VPVLDSGSGPMAPILVVCTGNVCRSPLAQGFLDAALRTRLGEAAPSVASAGTAGWDGSGAMPEAVAAAAERGVDIAGHRARRLLTSHVEEVDLVIGMATEHREAVADAMPQIAGKAFTLKELVRLVEALPPATVAGDPEARLVARVGEADELRRNGFEGNPNDEDVVDPLGQPVESFRAIAWELQEWCERLAEGLFGRTPARVAGKTEGSDRANRDGM
jgi:protein-tyrosine phosphatase